MKRTITSIAVGSALAASASAAFALAPGAFDPATIPQVRMSGATAQDLGIVAYMRRVCNAGTLNQYFQANARSVFICTHSTLGNIAVHKESALGSANGVAPVRDAIPLLFINLTSINTSNCSSSGAGFGTQAAVTPIAPDTLGLPAFTRWNCSATTNVSAAPHVGFTDVEPAIFNESSTGLTIASPNQLMFGIPVTKKLRDDLQTAQGKLSGSETAANVPNLTLSQVAGLFAGIGTSADFLGIGNTNTIGIARRVDTSGSQKSAELNILNQNVNPAANPVAFVAPDASGVHTAGICAANRVFAGNGTGDVRNCLGELQDLNQYGVGLMSMESVYATSGTGVAAKWRWVRLNGAMPTLANVINGSYPFWVEQAVTRQDTLTGTPLSLFTDIAAKLGDPGILAILNGSFQVFNNTLMGGAGEPAGSQGTGLLLPPLVAGTLTCPPTFASGPTTADTDPRNILSKSVAGATDNRTLPAVAVCAPR